MTEEVGRSEGLLESLRNLARTFLAIVQTRIEIFASEIDEERTRLARIAVLVAVDRGIAWASWLRARPYLVVAAATAIAVLRPRLALEWSARLLTLWRVGRLLYDAIKPAAGERARPSPRDSYG